MRYKSVKRQDLTLKFIAYVVFMKFETKIN